MSEKTQRLDIVTPQKKIFSEDVRFFVAPGSEGELGLLPDHAAIITALKIGILRIEQEGKKFNIAVSGGFLEVRDSRATVLATAAERAEDINVERAEAAKQRAEQRLAAKAPDLDVLRAEMALKRALNRLKAAGH